MAFCRPRKWVAVSGHQDSSDTTLVFGWKEPWTFYELPDPGVVVPDPENWTYVVINFFPGTPGWESQYLRAYQRIFLRNNNYPYQLLYPHVLHFDSIGEGETNRLAIIWPYAQDFAGNFIDSILPPEAQAWEHECQDEMIACCWVAYELAKKFRIPIPTPVPGGGGGGNE